MNSLISKPAYLPDQMQGLRDQLMQFKGVDPAHTWQSLGRAIGVANSTLSLWATGKYTGDNQSIAAKVDQWFRAEEVQLQLLDERPSVPDFQMTKTASQIHSILSFARLGKWVAIIGNPGVGKTIAIQRYAAMTPNIWIATVSPASKTVTNMLKVVAHAVMGSIPTASGSLSLSATVRDRVRGAKGVIVIEEAQNLDQLAIEELRAIHDDTKVGMVFCGNMEVLSRVDGNRQNAFAQRFSRLAIRHFFEAALPDDISTLLDAWGVTDAAQRKYLVKIANKPGALRMMSHTLELANILAQQSGAENRTLQDIEDAWAQISHQPGIAA
jgi:DNA transposition AAA+ family ATPase